MEGFSPCPIPSFCLPREVAVVSVHLFHFFTNKKKTHMITCATLGRGGGLSISEENARSIND